MSRYITTKADFTIRRKHKKGSGSTIYENDYTTINPMPNALKGEYVIGDSNFVFTARQGVNSQKRHVRGEFLPNPSGSTEERGAWTIDTLIDSGISDETRIRLKPNHDSVTDFACYGSAVKLIQGTVNGVISDFPAEMWFSKDEVTIYKADNGAGYSFYDGGESEALYTGYLFYNEYNIDFFSKNIQQEVYNPLRFFALCGTSYNYIDPQGTSHEFVGYTVESGECLGSCSSGQPVELDYIYTVTLAFQGDISITVDGYRDTDSSELYWVYRTSSYSPQGGHIRPKEDIIEEYFRECDDFTALLLDRTSNPVYTSRLRTPRTADTGFYYDIIPYTWPTVNGGYNPDLSGPYYSYLESLINLGEYYDEYDSDNIWRSLTHEAIKTLDWTYVSNSDGDTEDLSEIDTSRIEPVTKIYGRQFDDLKRYADGIKRANVITYDGKGNTPDNALTPILENSGWEVRNLNITDDKKYRTPSLYPGLSNGYTASETNSEFLRRLKLNSRYLFSVKGTRKGIDAMLGMLGLRPNDYVVREYVYVAKGRTGGYGHFCDRTEQLTRNIPGKIPLYPLAEDTAIINKHKINFNINDPFGAYCGIPVTEVGYFVENPSDPDNPYDCSYVIPWYSQGKKYDDGLYFQMNGGWGNRHERKVKPIIGTTPTSITQTSVVGLYDETQTRLKFAKDFDEMLQEAFISSNTLDVFYVTDISGINDRYTFRDGEVKTGLSHYFILENQALDQFLGYSRTGTIIGYGWRNIKESEFRGADPSSAGTMVLYLESIIDDTTGNNPHIGGGTYDGGRAYIDSMSNIFGHALGTKSFIGINDNTCNKIANYIFDCERVEDNRKCWYFTDNYIDNRTDQTCENGEKCQACENDANNKQCWWLRETGDLPCGTYDLDSLISAAKANAMNLLGAPAAPEMTLPADMIDSGYNYNRESNLFLYDPELGTSAYTGEAGANSIINVKDLVIDFLPSGSPLYNTSFEDEMIEYINSTVLPYLTQMLPSTSVLYWSFKGDNSGSTAPSSYLTATRSQDDIDSENTTVIAVTVRSNVSWTASIIDGNSYFEIDTGRTPDHQTGNGSLIIKGKGKNLGSDRLTGILSVTGGNRNIAISLGQAAFVDNATLTVTRLTPATVGWQSSTARFKVTWEGLVGDPVITVTGPDGQPVATSGTTSQPTFVIPDNLTDSRPEYTLTATGESRAGAVLTASAKVTQGPVIENVSFRVIPEKKIFPATATAATFHIVWADMDPETISVTVPTTGVVTSSITAGAMSVIISFPENEEHESKEITLTATGKTSLSKETREASATITHAASGAYEYIDVGLLGTLEQKEPDVTPKTATLIGSLSQRREEDEP